MNPTLYALASSNPEVFHDITVGNNIVTVAVSCLGGRTRAGRRRSAGTRRSAMTMRRDSAPSTFISWCRRGVAQRRTSHRRISA